jgi:TRAP-type uncharacterized transport system substrate-binding protein
MHLRYLSITLVILILKINSAYSLTQDVSLTILVQSPLKMEYVLAKSICKLLDRDLRISHSFGGSNTLECDIRFDESADEIISKQDILNRPSNLSIRSVLYFPADQEYIFITNQNVDPEIIKEINYGIINHLLEFQYLHPSFINFSENNLIIKQDIPMHMGTLRFNDEWRDEKKRRFIEVD